MKKGQTFTFDLILAVAVIAVVGVLVVNFGLGIPRAPKEKIEAQALAGAIFNPFPSDYNSSSVIIPGFVENHEFSELLFAAYLNLSYDDIQDLTGIRSDFFVNVTLGNQTINSTGIPPNMVNASYIYSLKRYAAYNGSIAVIEVITWS